MVRMYVKVFGSILRSSVWDTDPATRIAWLTMLVEADETGFVRGTTTALARLANLTEKQVQAALKIFTSPDPESATPDQDGRRIEPTDGGWFLINYKKYREIRTKAQLQTAQRVAKFRAKKHDEEALHVAGVTTNATATALAGEEEGEGRVASASVKKAKARSKDVDHPRFGEFKIAYPKRDGGQGWQRANELFTELVESGDADAETLITVARAYGEAMKRCESYGTSTVKQAQTFLGPGNWWQEDYSEPERPLSEDEKADLLRRAAMNA
jgi:hypothetical protein